MLRVKAGTLAQIRASTNGSPHLSDRVWIRPQGQIKYPMWTRPTRASFADQERHRKPLSYLTQRLAMRTATSKARGRHLPRLTRASSIWSPSWAIQWSMLWGWTTKRGAYTISSLLNSLTTIGLSREQTALSTRFRNSCQMGASRSWTKKAWLSRLTKSHRSNSTQRSITSHSLDMKRRTIFWYEISHYLLISTLDNIA